jgi:hypothetical protein
VSDASREPAEHGVPPSAVAPGISVDRPPRHTRAGWLAAAVVIVVLLGRLSVLIHRYGVNVYVWDQWDFLDVLFQPRSLWKMFNWKHGPHRMGIGLPLMAFVEQATRWNAVAIAYLSAVVTAMAAVLAVHLEYRVSRSLGWTDLVIPLLVLNTSQWQVFVAIPNTSHGPLPLLLVIAFCTVLTARPGVARMLGLVALDVLSLYTGFGLWLGVIAPLVFLLELRAAGRARRMLALGALLASLAALGAFFTNYHFGRSGCAVFSDPQPWRYPAFVAVLFARAVGATRLSGPLIALGAPLLAGLVWVTVASFIADIRRTRDVSTAPRVVWVLGTFTLLFAAATAAGRACHGMRIRVLSHYVPYIVPGLLALYLYCTERARRTGKTRALTAAVLLYIGLELWPRSVDRRGMRYYHDGKARWVTCYLKHGDPEACQARAGFSIYEDPRSPRLRDKLAFLREHGLGFFAPP